MAGLETRNDQSSSAIGLIMSFNDAGGARGIIDRKDVLQSRMSVINDVDPIALVIQEMVIRGGKSELIKVLSTHYKCFFWPTLSKKWHFHPEKSLFADAGKEEDIEQGLALCVRRDIAFGSPFSPEHAGPFVIPLLPLGLYHGNRENEPRIALGTYLLELDVLCIGVHLSSLIDEDVDGRRVPSTRGIALRRSQVEAIATAIERLREECDLRSSSVVVIGDFNCTPDSAELDPLCKLGLEPVSTGESTHRKRHVEIDFAMATWYERPRLVDLGNTTDHMGFVLELST